MPEGRREIWLSVPGDSLDPSLWIGGTTRRFGSAGLAGPRPAQHLCRVCSGGNQVRLVAGFSIALPNAPGLRSEEHTSELQSLMRLLYAVFCLKKKQRQK